MKNRDGLNNTSTQNKIGESINTIENKNKN